MLSPVADALSQIACLFQGRFAEHAAALTKSLMVVSGKGSGVILQPSRPVEPSSAFLATAPNSHLPTVVWDLVKMYQMGLTDVLVLIALH